MTNIHSEQTGDIFGGHGIISSLKKPVQNRFQIEYASKIKDLSKHDLQDGGNSIMIFAFHPQEGS